jgi:EF-P beta-lysylation protein EpmB
VVLRKYRGRALLTVTGGCAVHCRYCFRRHLHLASCGIDGERLAAALDALGSEEALEEVILSGGDPLLVDDDRLAELARRIAELPRVRRLRVHTRLPVMVPGRVTDELLAWLTGTRLQPVVVLHVNHRQELDETTAAAVAELRRVGVTVLNQSVLLRGVNDSVRALCELSTALFEVGVLPYYLHMLDRVQGAAHFEVGEARARELLTGVRARLSGYLVPRLVREIPGEPAKTPL